jgi:RNA polymerase sigma factor (sigma-70 family)
MLDELLDWLDPDRQVAGQRYEEIRRSLVKVFAWRRCADAEGMADDTIDRVAAKVRTLREKYDGNPYRYFFGVARNLIREYQKTLDLHVSLTDLDLSLDLVSAGDRRDLEREDTCLRQCLERLPVEQRQQIVKYYGGQKQEKIRLRREMAEELGIGQNTLRVRMHRLRATLETCIETCLEKRLSNETE